MEHLIQAAYANDYVPVTHPHDPLKSRPPRDRRIWAASLRSGRSLARVANAPTSCWRFELSASFQSRPPGGGVASF